jgi:hypothetical protein
MYLGLKMNISNDFREFLEQPREKQDIEKYVDFMVSNNLQRKVDDNEYVEFLTPDGIAGIKTISDGVQANKGRAFWSNNSVEMNNIQINFNEYIQHLLESKTPKTSPSFLVLNKDSVSFNEILNSNSANFDLVSHEVVTQFEKKASEKANLKVASVKP